MSLNLYLKDTLGPRLDNEILNKGRLIKNMKHMAHVRVVLLSIPRNEPSKR